MYKINCNNYVENKIVGILLNMITSSSAREAALNATKEPDMCFESVDFPIYQKY